MAQKLCSSLVVVMKAAIIARARVCKCSHGSNSMLLEIFDERLQRRKIPTLSLQKKTQMQRGEHVHCIRRRSFDMEVYRCRFGLHQSTRVHTMCTAFVYEMLPA
jgi:hypothetical protein